MRSVAMILVPLGIVLFCAMPIDSSAQWTETGTDICIHDYGVGAPAVTGDSAGGAVIAWLDASVTPYQIYAQRVTSYGHAMWTAGGTAVTAGTVPPQVFVMASDGMAGAYIAWIDNRNGNNDIFMQRVDQGGNILWAVGGIAVCTADGSQASINMVEDEMGGVIIVWDDDRSGAVGIYAQRIGPGGTSMWTSDGVPVVTSMFTSMEYPKVAADGAGGATVAWKTFAAMNNFDLYAQGINADGTIKWSWLPGGSVICNDSSDMGTYQIEKSGSGSSIIVWNDSRNGSSDLWASFIDGSGNTWWTNNGEPVCTASGDQYWTDLTSDGLGGIIIAWSDFRNGAVDIYAQRISAYGTKFWGTDGMSVCTAEGSQIEPDVMPDGDGGAVIVWTDLRTWEYSIYGQRVDSGGGVFWELDGARVRSSTPYMSDCSFVSDGSGGAIGAWREIRSGSDYDIIATRVEANGYWGYPAPAVGGVADVPNDQGGQVTVEWASSRLDAFPELDITHYSVWRSISPAEAAALQTGGKKVVDVRKTGELPVSSEAELILDGTGYAWEWLADRTSLTQPQYSYTAATLWDSTGLGNEKSHFMVAAHTATPSVFWFSAADSGYSVDNLAPGVPLGLEGEQSFAPEGLALSWDPNTEPDLFGYRVYRDIDASFEPGPGNFVTSTQDTFSFDGGWSWDSGFAYKVTAVDIHGNESLWALLMPTEVTGDDPMPLPGATFLAQNFPNPFNPNTTIAFGLKSGGFVNLGIYDAAGRLVAELINESRPAGQYAAVWNGKARNGSSAASGVYFYRLITKEFEETKKMILLR